MMTRRWLLAAGLVLVLSFELAVSVVAQSERGPYARIAVLRPHDGDMVDFEAGVHSASGMASPGQGPMDLVRLDDLGCRSATLVRLCNFWSFGCQFEYPGFARRRRTTFRT